MATKSTKLFCFGCDVEFTVKFSDEDTKLSVGYCPFCGDTVDDEDDVPDEDDSDEDSDDGDRWG